MKSIQPKSRSSYISSKEAIRILGIKPQSLYAYVSRGWIRSIRGKETRDRLYLRSDVERLRARQRARSGHGPAAASAARWGEPILESSITHVSGSRLYYRSRDAIRDLAEPGLRFENVAEYLWSGSWVGLESPILWEPSGAYAKHFENARKHEDAKMRVAAFISSLALSGEKEKDAREDQSLALIRSVFPWIACLLSGARAASKKETRSIAEILAHGWGLQETRAIRCIDRMLVVCADHELNASTFVARVAASNGVDLLLCLEASLAAHRGTRQGLVSDELESWIARSGSSRGPLDLENVPGLSGFGHPLYPEGDPRARFLLDAVSELDGASGRNPGLKALYRVIDAMKERYDQSPSMDSALLAMSLALGLPPQSASAIFCFARIAGWVAHILEQRKQGFQIRPRAKYVPQVSQGSEDPQEKS